MNMEAEWKRDELSDGGYEHDKQQECQYINEFSGHNGTLNGQTVGLNSVLGHDTYIYFEDTVREVRGDSGSNTENRPKEHGPTSNCAAIQT